MWFQKQPLSAPRLESTCSKFNWLDTPVCIRSQWTIILRSKNWLQAQGQDIIEALSYRELQKLASSFWNVWKEQRQNWDLGKQALLRDMKRDPMVPMVELQRSWVQMGEDQPGQTPPQLHFFGGNQAWLISWSIASLQGSIVLWGVFQECECWECVAEYFIHHTSNIVCGKEGGIHN